MALPALAQIDDLFSDLGENLDTGRALGKLELASTIVRTFTGQGWLIGERANVAAYERSSVLDSDSKLTAVPDAIRQVTVNVAVRAYRVLDDTVTSETVGPVSVGRTAGLWLSATDRMMLEGYTSANAMQSISPPSLSTIWPMNRLLVGIEGDPLADLVDFPNEV